MKHSELVSDSGAEITMAEIARQPDLWQQIGELYLTLKPQIDAFLQEVLYYHERVQVIFTGAGTSAYIGDMLVAYLKSAGNPRFSFSSVATTELVACPYLYFREQPTLLVSFARSGNSPESIAAVELAKQLTQRLYQLTITCAADGQLARQAECGGNNFLLLLPDDANDQGFAMTGSFTGMALAALFVFDAASDAQKQTWLSGIRAIGQYILDHEREVVALLPVDTERVVYLGSGPLTALAREALLKVLELTGGRVAALYDSALGFRHGPKSFVDEKTVVFDFVSNDEYTRNYDFDILQEVFTDGVAAGVCAVTLSGADVPAGISVFDCKYDAKGLPDIYLALAYVVFAQIVAVHLAIRFGNRADTPSPDGTVNRVVKGVQIHPYQ